MADGLKCLPEATVQACIVHLIRHSLLASVLWEECKALVAALKAVY